MNKGKHETNLRSLAHAVQAGWAIISIEPKRPSEILEPPESNGDIRGLTLTGIEGSVVEGDDLALFLEGSRNPPLVIGCNQNHPMNEILTPTAMMGNWVFKFFEMTDDPQVLAHLLKPRIVWDYEVYYDQGMVPFPPCTNPITGCVCEWLKGKALHEIPLANIKDYLSAFVSE